MNGAALRAPYPWWGGKSRAAHLVWPRLGNVRTYVESFYGSGAMLLARQVELAKLGIEWAPGDTIETINDADCYVSNFWRATKLAPELVAEYADWPVTEADLRARHGWLVNQSEFREQMMNRRLPWYFDPMIAGWWVWGISCWIGSGWCYTEPGKKTGPRLDGSTQRRRPRVPGRQAGDGVHAKRPMVGSRNAGRGVHRQTPRANAQGGQGVHGHRVAQKRPMLSGNGGGAGIHSSHRRNHLEPLFLALQHRLRPVRVVCGDFERVVGPSVVLPDTGVAALFLDPPYPAVAGRREELYSVDCGDVAHRAHQVALAWGCVEHRDEAFCDLAVPTAELKKAGWDPRRRLEQLRIPQTDRVRVAFCGYEGTHAFPQDWEEVAWQATGGYGAGRNGRAEENASRERIWFSPACLKPEPEPEQLELP